jgi:hypothetical protein
MLNACTCWQLDQRSCNNVCATDVPRHWCRQSLQPSQCLAKNTFRISSSQITLSSPRKSEQHCKHMPSAATAVQLQAASWYPMASYGKLKNNTL